MEIEITEQQTCYTSIAERQMDRRITLHYIFIFGAGCNIKNFDKSSSYVICFSFFPFTPGENTKGLTWLIQTYQISTLLVLIVWLCCWSDWMDEGKQTDTAVAATYELWENVIRNIIYTSSNFHAQFVHSSVISLESTTGKIILI